MRCDCTILSLASIKTMVGCNPIVVVKNFNGFICNSHINFAFNIYFEIELWIVVWN